METTLAVRWDSKWALGAAKFATGVNKTVFEKQNA